MSICSKTAKTKVRFRPEGDVLEPVKNRGGFLAVRSLDVVRHVFPKYGSGVRSAIFKAVYMDARHRPDFVVIEPDSRVLTYLSAARGGESTTSTALQCRVPRSKRPILISPCLVRVQFGLSDRFADKS